MSIEVYDEIYERIRTLLDTPGWFSKLRGMITLILSLGVIAGLMVTVIFAGVCKFFLLGVTPYQHVEAEIEPVPAKKVQKYRDVRNYSRS